MIGVDTNLLVRFIVQDDRNQGIAASRLINKGLAEDGVYVSQIVLCELVWVLRRSYGIEKSDIVKTLNTLLAETGFFIESRHLVVAAVSDYARGQADFSDYLIGHTSSAQGVTTVFTFDKKLDKAKAFKVVIG